MPATLSDKVHRRLAAILAADVVGYSRLMRADEVATIRDLAIRRALIEKVVSEHGGRIVNHAGDSVLAEFPSVVAAVEAAVLIQRHIAEMNEGVPDTRAMAFRIGLHLGDVVVRDETIYGDGVNVAARLQAQADPGGILVSDLVRDQVHRRMPVRLSEFGTLELKNLDEPLRTFRVEPGAGSNMPADRAVKPRPSRKAKSGSGADARAHAVVIAAPAGRERDPPASPGGAQSFGRVLAILPFRIGATDERWERIAHGFCDDLAANLSRFRALNVIATHSSFQAAKEHVEIPRIADRLRAQYLVQGSVTVTETRLKVVAGLIDGCNGVQVWSERFEERSTDLFEVLDKVSSQLSAVLANRLEYIEQANVRLKRPDSLRSYELLLRGFEHYMKHTKTGNELARAAFRGAIALDQGLARAYTGLSKTYNLEWRYRWGENAARALDMALEVATMAVGLDRLDARAYSELGFAHLYRREFDASLHAYERAMEFNPNDADVLAEYGDSLVYHGEPARALSVLERAKLLNPIHPDWYLWCEGGAHYQAGQYQRAIDVLRAMNDPAEGSRLLAASFAQLGAIEDAKRHAAIVLAKHPRFSISDWQKTQPFRQAGDGERFVAGLRLAGLPH